MRKQIPQEIRTCGNLSFKNSESGAGEQFLLLLCKGLQKKIVFVTDTGRTSRLKSLQLTTCLLANLVTFVGWHSLSNATCLIRPRMLCVLLCQESSYFATLGTCLCLFIGPADCNQYNCNHMLFSEASIV